MNRVCSHDKGYTMVETLIFLAVTGVIFASTISVISGQQARTEFTQAVRGVQTQILDLSNDVATGYYSNPGNVRCQAVGSPPRPHINFPSGSDQGRNEECIFIGRALQFAPAPAGAAETINVYNIVGLRKIAAGTESKDYSEAKPTAMAPGATTNTGMPAVAIQTINLEGGITAGYIRSDHNGTITNIGGFAYMSTLAQYSLGLIASGSLSLDIVPIGTGPGMSSGAFVDQINSFNTSSPLKNPNRGIVICYNSANMDQHALFTFGADRKLTPFVEILQGPCV